MNLCTKDKFPTVSLDDFNGAGLSGFYCPKNYSDMFLEGSFVSSSLNSISFTAKKCDFQNNPDKCGTKEEIYNFITSNVLNYYVFFIENFISIGNYANPFHPVVTGSYKFFQSNNRKITTFIIQQNYLKTDTVILSTN